MARIYELSYWSGMLCIQLSRESFFEQSINAILLASQRTKSSNMDPGG